MGLLDRRRSKPTWMTASGNPLRVSSSKNGLVASGFRVGRRDADTMRRLVQPWQARAFAYYDMLGEIKYAAQFYSRALATLRIYPAEMDENGDLVETEDPDAIALLDRVQDPGGGRSGLLGSYGRLMFLTGECYLFVSQDDDTGAEQWEMLSTDELRPTGGGYIRYKAPSMAAENYHIPGDDDFEPINDDTAVAYRLWRRHPRYSMLADSTLQGILDLCEELVLLTQAVRARARSRLAGTGILFLSDEFSPPPLEPVGDEDPLEDPFLADLTEAMTQPIVDEGAASAIVPLIVRGDKEAIKDGIKHVQIVDPTQLYPETGLRRECIERIAIGLDMPPEILLGLSDSNHWSAWQIDEQVWKAHLQPVAQQLVDDLTASYFRPALRQMGRADWDQYSIAYDASAIVNHPDRTKDAKELYDRRAIGKAALRDAAGFDEEDAPTDEELDEMLGVAIRDASLAKYGIPAVKGTGLEPEAGELETGTGEVTSAETVKAPPEENTNDEQPLNTVIGGGNGHSAHAARIAGAADLALHRAREIAGSRIRNHAKRDPVAAALIDGVRNGQVAATLGREKVREIKAPIDQILVSGAGDLVEDALRLWGINDKVAVELISAKIEQHAARTLYDERPSPLPPSFQNYILGLRV